VGECLTAWDTVLPVAEFTYNSSINKSTGLSPFEIVDQPIDLLPLPIGDRPSASANLFAQQLLICMMAFVSK